MSESPKQYRFFVRAPDGFRPISKLNPAAQEDIIALQDEGFSWKTSVYWEDYKGIKDTSIPGEFQGVPIEYWDNIQIEIEGIRYSSLIYVKGGYESYSAALFVRFGVDARFLEEIDKVRESQLKVLTQKVAKPKKKKAVLGARRIKIISNQ